LAKPGLGEIREKASGEWPEVWRAIPRHPPYEASCWGRVRNGRTGRVLVPHDKDGYLRVDLGPSKRLVHALVLEAFAGPCPPGHEARHVHDPTRDNCALWNLAWGTKKENGADRVRHGTSRGRGPDMIGRVFGELRVLARDMTARHNARWICVCSCGRQHVVRGDLLLCGKSSRCRPCAVRRETDSRATRKERG
jgi:hypothetical protein